MFVTVDALAREYDSLIHFTPTIDQRKRFAKQGVAMPGGSFYIRNASDLDNAIAAVGRATPNANESETARRNAVRRHIMERARFLKLQDRIPGTWNSDGSLKHSGIQGLHPDVLICDEEIEHILADLATDEFLEHHGVKGMHWGVHHQRALELHSNVANGTASMRQKLVARSEMTALDNIRHKGSVESFSKEKARKLQAQKDRVKSGKATTKDKLDLASSLTAEDLLRQVARRPRADRTAAFHSEMDEVDEFLAHFGVKGMKWGVRRAEKRAARQDRKFTRAASSNRVWMKTYNQAARRMNSEHIERINNDPRFKDKDFTKDTPLRRKYYGEMHKAFINELEQAASDQGTSKSGNLKYTILEGHDGDWRVVTKEVKHMDGEPVVVHLTFDSTGHITGIEIPGDAMTQAEEIEDFLAHFGVKGMQWGVRRSRSTGTVSPPHTGPRRGNPPGASTPSHTAPRRGRFPGTPGPASRRVGMPKQHHPVADDAARTLQLKSQLSKHGPQSLTNADLQHLVKRMQLENQLRQLDPVHKSTGRKVVDEAVKIGGNAAKQTAAQFAAKYAAEGASHLIKLAIKMK